MDGEGPHGFPAFLHTRGSGERRNRGSGLVPKRRVRCASVFHAVEQEGTKDLAGFDDQLGPGRRSTRRAPPNGLFSRDAVPPCRWACWATNASPRPEPECDAVEPRENRSNTTWRSASGSPLPLSSTAISTPARELTADSCTPVAPPCLTALAMALSTASRSPAGSPTMMQVGEGASDTSRSG